MESLAKLICGANYDFEISGPPLGRCYTVDIVSKTAYLIGVADYYFIPENGPFNRLEYDKLEKEKPARIVRNLCMLRTMIELNHARIKKQIREEYRSLYSIEEISVIIENLMKDGIDIVKITDRNLHKVVAEINKEISNRINNCMQYFPDWIVWKYLKSIFIMPNGTTEKGVQKHVREVYFPNRDHYPYRLYINWKPRDCGNPLENDEKFLQIVYEQHGDMFADLSKVTMLDVVTESNILDFIENSGRLDIIVDCENVNPYRLAVTLNSLDPLVAEKIHKLILVDDPNTVKIWKNFGRYVKGYNIEYRMNQRIKFTKSLVDGDLIGQVYREFFQNCIDSFMICSSDSDYYSLISGLPEAKFLMLGEEKNMGKDMTDALRGANVYFAYIESFYSGGTGQDIKDRVIMEEIKEQINRTAVGELNLKNVLHNALYEVKIMMTDEEREQFYKKHLRPAILEINDDGSVNIRLKR